MPRYTCSGFRSVEADNIKEAAAVFAHRQAVREYGRRRGHWRTLRQDCWILGRQDDVVGATYQAFIGYHPIVGGRRLSETTGHDIWLHVYRSEE